MRLRSDSLRTFERVPAKNAMGVLGDDGPGPGPNVSPHLAWTEVPPGTESFVVICVDPDAPDKSNANRPGFIIGYDMPRGDFFHWVLIDLPKNVGQLKEGADGAGIVAKGKPAGPTAQGVRGLNSYTEWFGTDPAMGGEYGGYDGPWPPPNDEREHRYVFTVYALSVASLGLAKPRGPEVLAAMEGKILAEATLPTTYSLFRNPRPAPR